MISIMSCLMRDLFERHAIARAYAAGDYLFHSGDPVRVVHLCLTGEVALRRVTRSGADLILNVARAGDVVAEAAAFAEAYHCDAQSLEDSDTLAVPVESFLSVLAANPELALDWATKLARGLQAARRRAEIRTIRTVGGRLDAWLETGGAVPAKGRWQDLAAELGVSREALYRELASRRS